MANQCTEFEVSSLAIPEIF